MSGLECKYLTIIILLNEAECDDVPFNDTIV